MSDDISLRYRNRKVFQLVMGNTIEPVLPYQRQWVAHWTQASNSLSLQSNEHCAATNATKDQIGQHCYLPFETMKPSYTCECKNGWRRDLGKQDPASYMLQSLEAQGGDKGRYTIIMNSVLNRSGFKTLKKLPEHKFPDSSANWENITSYHFQNSRSPTPEWTHFPMFDINRKLETIMAPKKRTSSDTMDGKMNEQLFSLRESPLSPHLREFESEGQHQQQNIARIDEEMRPYGSVEGLPHYMCHSPNMTSSMQNDEGDNMVCFGSSGTRMKDGSSPCSGYVPHLRVAEECSDERGIACGRNRTTRGPSKSNRMSNCSTSGSRKRESERFSSGSKHFPMGRGLWRKDKTAGGSTVFSNVKGTAFFEKVTLPASSHHLGQQEKNLQNLVSSTNNLEDVDGIDTQFMKKENEPLVITNPVHIDLHGKPGSPEVGSSFELQKITLKQMVLQPPLPETKNSYQANIKMTNIPQDVVHPDLKRTDIAVTDRSGSESTGALSKKTSNPPAESTQNDSEQCLKWVKRLQPSSLDPILLGTKKFKVGDASSSAEVQNLLTKVVNYNRSISELPECQQIDKKTFSPKNGECSAGDSEKIMPWIRRWCRRSQETASLTPGLCDPENSKVPPEKFEAKQFPSLAAMALMGKQVTNFRPCEFHKRGSTIVWKN